MGAFCSWGCMKAFNLDRNKNEGGIIGQYILIMRKQMCHECIKPIKSAPSRFVLKEFGGTMTIEEFRSFGDTTGQVFSLPDEVHRLQPKDTLKSANTTGTTKMQDINNSVTTNETLKLKRPQPLKRDENNLEKSLGITRKR